MTAAEAVADKWFLYLRWWLRIISRSGIAETSVSLNVFCNIYCYRNMTYRMTVGWTVLGIIKRILRMYWQRSYLRALIINWFNRIALSILIRVTHGVYLHKYCLLWYSHGQKHRIIVGMLYNFAKQCHLDVLFTSSSKHFLTI